MLILLAVAGAWACECTGGITAWLPPNGSTNQGGSTRILFHSDSFVPELSHWGEDRLESALLHEDSGAWIPLTIHEQDNGNFHTMWFVPDELLEPGAYHLEAGGWEFFSFSVADWVDTSPPTGGELLGTSTRRKAVSTDSCGRWVYMDLELAVLEDDHLAYHEVEATRDGATTTYVFPDGEDTFIGWGPCISNNFDLAVGHRLELRTRAVDSSGNTSEWSEVGAGCTGCGGGGPIAWVWLLAPLALGRRRAALPKDRDRE